MLSMSLLPVRIVSDTRTRRMPVDLSTKRQADISPNVIPPTTQTTIVLGCTIPRGPLAVHPGKFVKSSKLLGSVVWPSRIFNTWACKVQCDFSMNNYLLIHLIEYKRCSRMLQTFRVSGSPNILKDVHTSF